ncbi:nucleotide exchange factor GrpE [Desulfopila inferna]|uniref:nucleotide exchange factor GrpE n=1 Tax=Desulfopila inferna TaxID=468528 RepID=UPI00307FBD22
MSKKEQNENIPEEEMGAENSPKTPAEGEETVTNGGAEASGDAEKRLEEQFAAAQEEVADLTDKLLRLAADFENYKKRSERERATTMKYAGEHIFREFLPVVDNLERAVSQGVAEDADAETKLAGLLEGVELTLKSVHATLRKFEVEPIKSVGEPFDPNKEEALTMEPSDTIPANHVVTEFEKGYFYKDRLLRAAKVTVSSGKAES